VSFHLDPVFRDIIQVLGVDIDLLEESPSGFYLSQVVFGFVLAPFPFKQSFFFPNLADSS